MNQEDSAVPLETEGLMMETTEDKRRALLWARRIGIFALLYATAFGLSLLSNTFVIMHAACRVNLGYPDDVCDSILSGNAKNYTAEQANNMYQVAATVSSWQSVIMNLLPVVCVTYMGSWSDRHGRKWAYVVPLVGGILGTALTVVAYYVDAPAEGLAAMFSIPVALFGGNPLVQTAIYSNMADVTLPVRRTFWTAVCLFFVGIGSGLGAIGAGTIYSYIGVWVFGVSCAVYIVILLYVIVFIPNVIPEQTESGADAHLLEEGTGTLKEKIKGILQHYIDLAKFAVRKREHNYRMKMLLLLLAYSLCAISVSGSGTVTTLFTNKVLGWNTQQSGTFVGISVYITIFGSALLIIPYKFIELPDSLICAFSSLSAFLMFAIITFAHSTAAMYTASAFGCLREIFIFLVKALISKIVLSDEIGKANALFTCGDTIGSLLAGPAYNGIYAATVNTFPSAFAILSCSLLIPSTMIYLYVYISGLLYRRRHRDSGLYIVVL